MTVLPLVQQVDVGMHRDNLYSYRWYSHGKFRELDHAVYYYYYYYYYSHDKCYYYSHDKCMSPDVRMFALSIEQRKAKPSQAAEAKRIPN
jgi:hypothetical protein